MRAVTNTHRELPPVNMGHSVDEFFEVVETESKEGKILPNWSVRFRCIRIYMSSLLHPPGKESYTSRYGP